MYTDTYAKINSMLQTQANIQDDKHVIQYFLLFLWYLNKKCCKNITHGDFAVFLHPQKPPAKKPPVYNRWFFYLAGMVGFEPTIHDTKNRCLTTWPHPNYKQSYKRF